MTTTLKPGTHPSLCLTPAQIDWAPQGPQACNYQDRYFHPEDGAGESRYVFLEHNQLPERFKALDARPFVIVETGFGTGLNCLEAITLFEAVAPPQAQLQIVSVDLHPLKKEDLKQAAKQWPHLAKPYQQLIAHYPPLIGGTHSIRWPGRNIELILHWDELSTLLDSLVPFVDCWFLDGFAPSKNPQMWTEQLFQRMATLATCSTTFATFTAASAVRRGLNAVGFEVTRCKGYGHKRHMLCGRFAGERLTPAPKPWHHHPGHKPQVAIIGAGIAGLSTAVTLQQAGYSVQLIEAKSSPCQGASGNRQAALYTRLSTSDQPINRFHNSALPAAINRLICLKALGLDVGFHPTALFEILSEKNAGRWAEQLTTAFLDPDWVELSTAAEQFVPQLSPESPLLCFPRAGWFSPKVCASQLIAWLERPPWFNHRVIGMEQDNEGRWCLHHEKPGQAQQDSTNNFSANTSSTKSFDAVVLCCPEQIAHLLPWLDAPLTPLPGQVNQVPQTQHTQALKQVLTGPCTLMPAFEGEHGIGSSYHPGTPEASFSLADSQLNLEKLRALSPVLQEAYAHLLPEHIPGRAATRWNTIDYLPLIGPATPPLLQDHTQTTGLWLNTGHGSRGFTQCWLAAEILLAHMQGSQFPVSKDTRLALAPSRFALRKTKKKRPRKW